MVALNKTYRKTLTPDRSAKDSGHRFYSAEISRWLSRDPIGENAAENVYYFLWNNPVGLTDLLGLLPSPFTLFGEPELLNPVNTQIIPENWDYQESTFERTEEVAREARWMRRDVQVTCEGGPCGPVTTNAFCKAYCDDWVRALLVYRVRYYPDLAEGLVAHVTLLRHTGRATGYSRMTGFIAHSRCGPETSTCPSTWEGDCKQELRRECRQLARDLVAGYRSRHPQTDQPPGPPPGTPYPPGQPQPSNAAQ